MNGIIESLQPLAAPIDSIRLDPRNARKHPTPNLIAIKNSLQAYGQRKPIVVNAKTGIIEAGNGLYMAAKELGWTEVAAVKVEDDKDTATGYALMDNQSALLAEWELPTLKDLLESLDTGAYDMDLTGFDAKTIEDLMTFVPQRFDAVGAPDSDQIAKRENELKTAFERKCEEEANTHINLICPECGKEYSVRLADLIKKSSV